MRAIRRTTVLLLVVMSTGCRLPDRGIDEQSPSRSLYSDETDRAIKALSPERIEGLLNGDGLGYAMAAELNGYPGPRHVLDMKEQLALTAAQEAEVRALFEQMREEAQSAGRALVALESRLDSLFAEHLVRDSDVRRLASEAADAEARVRRAHLEAHVKLVTILSSQQIATYNRLRGYSAGSHEGHTGHES